MFECANQRTFEGDIDDLTALKADYIANGYEVHLFQSPFAPTRESVAADFAAAEADFTGYGAISIGGAGFLFVGPVLNDAQEIVLKTPGMSFVATDAVNPNQIAGYWVENTAGDVLRYGVFPAPVDMSQALDFLDFTIYENVNGAGYAVVNN